MRFLSLIVSSLFLLPLFVFAHGANYLEFNPDQSQSLKIVDVAIPSQVFFAQNDFLGGVDMWFANPGPSGTAVFDLLNEQGTILTSKTIVISNIPETTSGTKLHIDFNSQVAVLADKKYSIRITSTIPGLRLYYSDRIRLVPHNAPPVSEYVTGVGKLGSEEQTFSFKYALYETNEVSAPIISNVAWTIISLSEMRLDFNANEPVDYRIEYGISGQGYTQSTSFTGGYHFCVQGASTCNLTLDVVPGTNYQYLLTIKDSWGNQSQSSGTFVSGQTSAPTPIVSSGATSLPKATPAPSLVGSPTISPAKTSTTTPISISAPPLPTDNASPVISNLRVVALTDKSVAIAWTTNEAANSHLLISTPFLITVVDNSDPTLELEHLIKIPDVLGFNTDYIATATSIDAGSNSSKASINFTTLAPDSSPPSSSLQQQNEQQVTTQSERSGGSVRWSSATGGEPSSGYRVDIFDKNGNLVKTVNVPAGSTSVDIPNLKEGEYSVIVYANNDGVFEKIDKPVELKIAPPFIKRLFSFWWALIPLLAGLGYILWRNMKENKSVTSNQ